MKKILILDDDVSLMHEVKSLLTYFPCEVFCCENVETARAVLDAPGGMDFAIVDLFLLGAKGDALSNAFVKEELEVRGIPYGRFSSAPAMIPKTHAGRWIVDKREFFRLPNVLLDRLLEVMAEE